MSSTCRCAKMKDAARPSDDEFNKVLRQSLKTWSSYLNTGSESHLIPLEAIDMKPLLRHTPPFLGRGLTPPDDKISFSCEEKVYPGVERGGPLLINGRSTWRTSKGICDLPPRVLEKQFRLGSRDLDRRNVKFIENTPFSEWPGVKGLAGYDKGNYISVLYFAWAYIFSARWVEMLERSADHECRIEYIVEDEKSSPQSTEQAMFQLDLGQDLPDEEVLWWQNILPSDIGWKASTKYNGNVYLAPWSVSAQDAGVSFSIDRKGLEAYKPLTEPPSPSSATALKYLTRFCESHRLYAQCSVALAGVIHLMVAGKRIISLPFPKNVPAGELNEPIDDSSVSISGLIAEHGELLPKYMTLSCNPHGLRSLLRCTFFNPDIECNMVSAWLNPAFAILTSISPTLDSDALVNVLINRNPRLGLLWLGAMFTGLANSILRESKSGMAAVDLLTSAWTETTHTFLTSKMGDTRGELINLDDECRLLFYTAHEYHARQPIWDWKPFGSTRLCDTELSVQYHAQCTDHCFEYESWEWILTDGTSIRHHGNKSSFLTPATENASSFVQESTVCQDSVDLKDYDYNFHSESLSEGYTRGIFMWLRMTGYPSNEKELYQHSWIDLEDTDEECEDNESGPGESERQNNFKLKTNIERWAEDIE